MNTKLDFPHSHQLYSELDHFISSTPLLSLEEEQAYALRGTAEARDRLVLSHLRLVKSIAFGFTGCGVDVKDIFNQGGAYQSGGSVSSLAWQTCHIRPSFYLRRDHLLPKQGTNTFPSPGTPTAFGE